MRFQRRDRIRVDHADHTESVLEAGCDTSTARAVAEHRHAPPVRDPVREAEKALEHALPDSVPILGELLDRAVVDHEHRLANRLSQRHEPRASRRRLLGASAQFRPWLCRVAREQIAAVVEQQVRVGHDDLVEKTIVLRRISRLLSADIDAAIAQVRGGLGLRRVQIPRCDDFGAPTPKREHERRRLRLEMDGRADLQPVERSRSFELRRGGC